MTFAQIFSTLLLLGTLQGFIMSGMLFFTRRRSRPNRLLGTLILLMALCCLNRYLYNASWFNADPLLRFFANFVPLILAMLFGPLLYFYVRASLDPSLKVGRRERRHFYPVIIDLVPQFTAFLYLGGLLSGLISSPPEPWGRFIDTYNIYVDIPRWLSLTAYLWLSARYLAKVQDSRPEYLRWIRQFIRFFLAFQLIWLLYLIPYVIPWLTEKVLNTVDWYPVYIPLVVLIYCLGIKGYLTAPRQEAETPKPPVPLQINIVADPLPLLKKAMEEDKMYLNPALNLTALSLRIMLSLSHIKTPVSLRGDTFYFFKNSVEIWNI